MQKDQIKKNLHSIVRLQPPFKSARTGQFRDEDWIIERIEDQGLAIKHLGSDIVYTFGYDHIHHFVSEPTRARGDQKFGVLVLNVQLTVDDYNVTMDPTSPPGTRR